jgi:hypothetical protein
VGDLKFNRKVWFGGVEMSAAEMMVQISPGERKYVPRIWRLLEIAKVRL